MQQPQSTNMKIFFFSIPITVLFIIQGAVVFASDVSTTTQAYGEFSPSRLSPNNHPVAIHWASHDGRQRLLRSKHNNDYFELSSHFQPQLNPLYCGIATSVIVLNSLRLPKKAAPNQTDIEVIVPKSLGGGTLPYPSFSQLTLLDIKTGKIKRRDVIELKAKNVENQYDPGLTLKQLRGVLESYDVKITTYHADSYTDKSIDKFRNTAKKVLRDDDHYLIVNINGRVYGSATDGHISPLAAYDEISDSVLLMDVAGYLNPWHWVPVRDLYAAMNTLDGNDYRGYLVISDKP